VPDIGGKARKIYESENKIHRMSPWEKVKVISDFLLT